MILQAWLTLPSCLASSSKPTLARMIFWSWVIVMVSIPGAGGRVAVPARGENRAPPPGTHFETNNDCQIKYKLLQLTTRDLERVVVATTVQPKAIAHPTDARLCHRALEKLVDLARRHDVPLRQSYRRVAKRAAIMVGCYRHAHQFKRARRALKFLRIRLGRVIRDIRRKIAGNEALQERFASLLALAVRVRLQDHRQRGHKIYALHAPEVECIGKGKARAPYEFGCKVSVITPATKPNAASLCCTPKHCTTTRSTATLWH